MMLRFHFCEKKVFLFIVTDWILGSFTRFEACVRYGIFRFFLIHGVAWRCQFLSIRLALLLINIEILIFQLCNKLNDENMPGFMLKC